MVFSHFLAEWTSYIIMPIIIIGNNIRVDIIGVSRAHTTKQIDEKSAQNGAKMLWKWSDFESVLHDLVNTIQIGDTTEVKKLESMDYISSSPLNLFSQFVSRWLLSQCISNYGL